ncbi:MAG TPA: biotin/lipoyl-containing protein, partial [Polyangia bacterium]
MAFEFKLPDLGEGVVEGEIVQWLVGEGEAVAEDQPLVQVMTDKATVEIPAPRGGRVRRQAVPAGQVCHVGQVLVVIDEERATEAPAVALERAAAPGGEAGEPAVAAARTAAPAPAPGPAPAPANGPAKALATPATRQLARELGVDLAALGGSGPGGR